MYEVLIIEHNPSVKVSKPLAYWTEVFDDEDNLQEYMQAVLSQTNNFNEGREEGDRVTVSILPVFVPFAERITIEELDV